MTSPVEARFHPLLRNATAVIFDAGGTIVHPDWQRLAQIVRAETGESFAADQLDRAFGQIISGIDQKLLSGTQANRLKTAHWVLLDVFCSLGLDEQKCARVRTQFDLEHQARHLWCQPYSDADDVLVGLKSAGLRMAVISNTEDGRLEDSLSSARLDSHFEFLIDSHLVGCRKPDAEIFRLTLKRLGIEPHEAVYVGDSYGYDVVGAQQAGLRSVLIDRLDRYGTIDCARIGTLRELIGTHVSGVL